MRVSLFALFLLILLVACKRTKPAPGELPSAPSHSSAGSAVSSQPMGPEQPASAPPPPTPQNWLDYEAPVQVRQRAALHPGTSVVDASYLGGRILVLLIEDSEEDDAKPDSARLSLIGGSAQAEKVESGTAGTPARLLSAPKRDWAACVFVDSADKTASAEPAAVGPQPSAAGPTPPSSVQPTPRLGLITLAAPEPGASGPAAPLTTTAKLAVVDTGGYIPVVVGNDNLLYLRSPAAVSVGSGRYLWAPDWAQPVRMAKLEAPSDLIEVKDPALLAAPDGESAVGLVPSLDPALPSWSLYRWSKSAGLESRLQTGLPVVAGALPDDAGSVAWVDADNVAVCYPASIGGDGQNWSLVVFGSEGAKPTLIADRLPPHTPVHALGGALIYCTPDESASGQWTLWAAGPDGMTKRKLHSAVARHAEVLDAAAAGVLLRLMLEDGTSSLLELSLAALPEWNVPADALSTAPQKGAPAVLGPAKPETEPLTVGPDAGSRYRRRDQGPQLPPGASPAPPSSPPSDGGRGGGKPDLRLPGL